jgi:hypothetical protein
MACRKTIRGGGGGDDTPVALGMNTDHCDTALAEVLCTVLHTLGGSERREMLGAAAVTELRQLTALLLLAYKHLSFIPSF